MPEIFVCSEGEMKNGSRRIVDVEGVEIGLYRYEDRYYAYRNLCLHQGGPACEGELLPKVEDVLSEDKTWQGHRFNEEDMHIVCPWHSYEFSLKTGKCAANPALKLKKYSVIERDGGIYVEI